MMVLCWDIDGTLLTTEKSGVSSWEEAVNRVLGRNFDLATLHTDGRTDMEIAIMILESLSIPADDATVSRLVSAYSDGLRDALVAGRRGRVLPGVIAILDMVRSRGVRSMLLTGNTEVGAQAKLKHYGLNQYFDHGSFSYPLVSRVEIAEYASEFVRQEYGVEYQKNMCVIGDTPFDIICGKHINARTIAVASGAYSREELSKHKPWWCISELPKPADFIEHLGVS